MKKYLSIKNVKEMFGANSDVTVKNLLERFNVPRYKDKNRYLYLEDDVQKVMEYLKNTNKEYMSLLELNTYVKRSINLDKNYVEDRLKIKTYEKVYYDFNLNTFVNGVKREDFKKYLNNAKNVALTNKNKYITKEDANNLLIKLGRDYTVDPLIKKFGLKTYQDINNKYAVLIDHIELQELLAKEDDKENYYTNSELFPILHLNARQAVSQYVKKHKLTVTQNRIVKGKKVNSFKKSEIQEHLKTVEEDFNYKTYTEALEDLGYATIESIAQKVKDYNIPNEPKKRKANGKWVNSLHKDVIKKMQDHYYEKNAVIADDNDYNYATMTEVGKLLDDVNLNYKVAENLLKHYGIKFYANKRFKGKESDGLALKAVKKDDLIHLKNTIEKENSKYYLLKDFAELGVDSRKFKRYPKAVYVAESHSLMTGVLKEDVQKYKDDLKKAEDDRKDAKIKKEELERKNKLEESEARKKDKKLKQAKIWYKNIQETRTFPQVGVVNVIKCLKTNYNLTDFDICRYANIDLYKCKKITNDLKNYDRKADVYCNKLMNLVLSGELDDLIPNNIDFQYEYEQYLKLNSYRNFMEGHRISATQEEFVNHFKNDFVGLNLFKNYIDSEDSSKMIEPSFDHIDPFSKNGDGSLENLKIMSFFENYLKNDFSEEAWESIKQTYNLIGDILIPPTIPSVKIFKGELNQKFTKILESNNDENMRMMVLRTHRNFFKNIVDDASYSYFKKYPNTLKLRVALYLTRSSYGINSYRNKKKNSDYVEDYSDYLNILDKFYNDSYLDFLIAKMLEGDCMYQPSIDHIVPLSQGGTNDASNLQILTWFENRGKYTLTQTEWDEFCNKNNLHCDLFKRDWQK